jgi:UDP:flavonoid glycosyltransferase YjiC (YdhE family)
LPLPTSLEPILQRDPAPIVISGGTSRQLKSEFYSQAINACALLGKETIVLTRYPDFLPDALPVNIHWFEHLPLDSLLRHVGILINHGGIGTVSGAIYAGVPQLVLPYHVDRPLNGSIVKALGVGDSLPPSHWHAETIAEKIRVLLSPNQRKFCQEFSQHIPFADPFKNLTDLVEDLIGNSTGAIQHSEIQALSINTNAKPSDFTPNSSRTLGHLSAETMAFLLQKKKSASQSIPNPVKG